MEIHPRQVKAVRHTAKSAAATTGSGIAPSAALFAIRLPFDLPVPDGAGFALRRSPSGDDPPWVEIAVRRIKAYPEDALLQPYEHGLSILLGELDPAPSSGASSQTWAMTSTINVLFDDERREIAASEAGFVSIAFERCLAAVNRVSQATRLVIGEIDTHPLTKDALDPIVTWFEVDVDSGQLGTAHDFRLHDRKYNPVFSGHDAAAVHATIADAVGRSLAADSTVETHPLLLPRAQALEAAGQHRRGDATGALVTLQSAAEGLLRGLHRLLLVDAGLPSAEILVESAKPFHTLFRTALPRLLGGSWTGKETVPTRYLDDLYTVRNRIVHAGRAPEWWQMRPAFAAYYNLVEFLDVRLLALWRSRPRTLKAWCEPWAGGTLPLPLAAVSVDAELEAEAAPYWLPADVADR